ncbi:MAG: hypothetical protein EZS28_010404 [Streblomastix strix]|uniref:Uncharacterized protein n=1 Tax=Streblomastix strix TaxID=222440 RepID=A0A5J4WGK2_9EUKA|nr:MAG: hypothetical protein EZS28_010404 [Streblomastix strix]
MTCRTNFANKCPPNRDSYQTSSYANIVPHNPLQVAAQPQSTFVNAFRQNIVNDPLDPDQSVATPEEIPSNAITAARVLLAGLTGQKTLQIDFKAEEPSEEQVIEAIQHTRAAKDLVTRRKLPKHNNPPAQLMLAFDQVLADLETKLLQQYKQLQGILVKIVRSDWIITQKFNLCTFISINDTIYKKDMIQELINSTEQGNLQKTQPSPVIRPSICRHVINEDGRLHRRTGSRTEEAKCATSQQLDKVQAKYNAARMGS